MVSIVYDNLPFPESDLASDEQNRELGRFFTAWGQIEVAYGFIFRELTQIDRDIGSIIFEKIGVKEQLEVLDELADLIAKPEAQKQLLLGISSARALSAFRNKLAHSRWGAFDGEPARFWMGLTEAHVQEIQNGTDKGKSHRAKFIMTLSDIKRLVKEAISARDILLKLHEALLLERLQLIGQPGGQPWLPKYPRHPLLTKR